MPRWIAFDQQTSSLLRTRLQQDRIETFGRGALDYALAKPGAVVTLFPSASGEIGLAVFRPPRSARIQPKPARVEPQPAKAIVSPPSPVSAKPGLPDRAGVARSGVEAPARANAAQPSAATRAIVPPPSSVTRAGGFLGLSDEPIFEEEEPVEQKKAWWRKFWDD